MAKQRIPSKIREASHQHLLLNETRKPEVNMNTTQEVSCCRGEFLPIMLENTQDKQHTAYKIKAVPTKFRSPYCHKEIRDNQETGRTLSDKWTDIRNPATIVETPKDIGRDKQAILQGKS